MNDHSAPLSQRLITVRTPDNIELSYALAGPGSRAVAYLLDFGLMLFVGQTLINVLVAAFLALTQGTDGEGQQWGQALASLMLFGLYNGYFILFEWFMNGQTPGKRLLRIRVVKQGGYVLSFFDTLLRNLLRVIDFLPLFYGLGLSSMVLTRNSQRLGDLAAATLVVYQEAVQTEALLPELPARDPNQPLLPAAAVAAVPESVLALLNQFLLTRGEMAPRVRQEIALELAGLVNQTSGLSARPDQATEGFLTEVFRQSAPVQESLSPPNPEAEYLSSMPAQTPSGDLS